jgi:hypothetical protein
MIDLTTQLKVLQIAATLAGPDRTGGETSTHTREERLRAATQTVLEVLKDESIWSGK